MPNLSNDVIEEILYRLPVKSVCRFKCVSKRWLHLTTQPHFVETHLNRTQKQKLIFGSNKSLFSLDHEAAIDDGNMVPSEIDFPLKGRPRTRAKNKMLGSCNGLVCIMPQPEALFIFNPCTGESMRVPDSPPAKNPKGKVLYSFGYAPSVKDYKLVKILLDQNKFGQNIMLMFSLKNKSWKVQDLTDEYMYCSRWTNWAPLNGAVHWLLEDSECEDNECVDSECEDDSEWEDSEWEDSECEDSECEDSECEDSECVDSECEDIECVDRDPSFIGALDLADGKFLDLPLPESFNRKYSNLSTGVLRGCLCFLEEMRLEFSCWVMEKYGVKESWTRIRISLGSKYFFGVKPICYWKNTKELLVISSGKLVRLADPRDGTYYIGPLKGNFYIPNFMSRSNLDVYEESLVSPNFSNTGQSEILRSSEVGMPSLSNKIIEEILSRLPVESVCRFKCVSKRWLHLTTQPHFIETHLNRTQKQKLIFSYNNSLVSLDHEGAIFDYDEGRMVLDPSELDFPLKGHPGTRVEIQMFGSCNGLVCIMPQPEALFIFNPCTGESMRVPDSPPTKNPNAAVLYGFGYAPSVKDYKLVKILLAQNIVLMFSLKNKSWKRVQDLTNKYMDYSIWKNWAPLNGAVHWLLEAIEYEKKDPLVIGALDLADGKFSDLPLPESFASSDFTTGVLRGCLCILEKIEIGIGLEYSCWVMEKYGVKESWTRIRFLAPDPEYIFSVKPICYWKNTKELLVRNGRKLVRLANPQDDTYYYVGPLEKNLYFPKFWAFSNFDVYVESLVSPNFQNE